MSWLERYDGSLQEELPIAMLHCLLQMSRQLLAQELLLDL